MSQVLITVRISFCYARLGIIWVSSTDYALNKCRNITQYIMGERMIYWSKWYNRNIFVPLLRGEPSCCCLWTDVPEVPFALPAHLPRRQSAHHRPANLTPSQGFVSKIVLEKCIIKDFLKHALNQFQAAKHLKDQCSGNYEMIYCVSDHLDTSYQWIIFLCHRKNICFHPLPKPEVIIHFIT